MCNTYEADNRLIHLEGKYNANAIRFLALILGRISANMERNLSTYQQLLANLDHLMDGLDTLSSGLLSHTIIPIGKLAEL